MDEESKFVKSERWEVDKWVEVAFEDYQIGDRFRVTNTDTGRIHGIGIVGSKPHKVNEQGNWGFMAEKLEVLDGVPMGQSA